MVAILTIAGSQAICAASYTGPDMSETKKHLMKLGLHQAPTDIKFTIMNINSWLRSNRMRWWSNKYILSLNLLDKQIGDGMM